MPRNYVRDNVPLSRFGVLVAQLESIVASASQQPPEPLLCFDLLSDLISAIDEEPQESILLWQRKCEDALFSLLTLGARRPVRHLASVAMARIIFKGDGIAIYSRASSLQGFLSDGRRSDPNRVAGVAQCLGELYRYFGRRITSGLLETTTIATKLMKFNEDFVRKEALYMLHHALEGSGGCAAFPAYNESFRLITRLACGDKSPVVRIAAARCLKAFANIGGPGLGVSELDLIASHCVKALEDPISAVRDAFAETLGLILALGMNPEAQVQPRGKGPIQVAKKLEGALQRHLLLPFTKATGARSKDARIGITLSWVSFLQAMYLKYSHPDTELQNYSVLVMDMLRADQSSDAHALACVLYILRVGITDQMTEPTQRTFLVFLGEQLQSSNLVPAMRVAALRTLSYTLKTVAEVPTEFKEILDDTVVAAVSHTSELVRIEAALTLHALAEVDPTCVGGLTSFGLTTLGALRDNISFEKGSSLKLQLDSLHGQAVALAALVSVSPKLPLGYPSRLPKSVLNISTSMLLESTRNPVASTVEKEAGWLLLSSLLASMPKQELEEQAFDILSLWAPTFGGNLDSEVLKSENLSSIIGVWEAAVEALTEFVRCFVSSNAVNDRILLQPVLVYLSSALSYLSMVMAKGALDLKPAVDKFTIRLLIAYQSLLDPMAYRTDHPQIIQLCLTPFREPTLCEESSCLKLLLDKRDAWLGPWTPGRDWFEDELRAFEGGKDGLMPSVWEKESSCFPQPETINKTLVNQKLLCFGVMFAFQDNAGLLSLLEVIENCLKTGKKQHWHAISITNICVGLLAGLRDMLTLRPQMLSSQILSLLQAIFLNIMLEGDICASQRRASAEGIGLLARLGDDIFTARLTRSLLAELTGATDPNYAGSVVFALGCIHRCAGGMALSSLVPPTVNSISSLAKSTAPTLQTWSVHGLLLTIEAAGLAYVSQVQATLGLALEILLSEDVGLVDLQQGIGSLVNAVVAVLGPELAPGSIFFSRCKSVIAEISSWEETATLIESVRFSQQLVLFAPQAVTVHTHVQNLLPTISSKQPILRRLAVSTLRHLIEKDPGSIIHEKIEDNLFYMLDEETDTEIRNLVKSTIMRLLYASCPSCPSRWISICKNMVLAISPGRSAQLEKIADKDTAKSTDGEMAFTEADDVNMVSHSQSLPGQGYSYDGMAIYHKHDKHLRYKTRVFAAECLRHLPAAVGNDHTHFDLLLARSQSSKGPATCDWLVLHIQELISLAYQISTIQFESMQPIGVELLSTITEKFQTIQDPELPGHRLLEQYQAQLVSAVRTALDTSSSPVLLEAGLQLATKILTSGVITRDQAAVKRIFSLLSRPLEDFSNIYYPSFAEWVSCKIKIRLLAAHASLKCYTYAFLRKGHPEAQEEYIALLPLLSRSSNSLGSLWMRLLKDFSYVCLGLHLRKEWKPFLDGLQSPLVTTNLQPCLKEVWPVILRALSLDAVPFDVCTNGGTENTPVTSKDSFSSGYDMVKVKPDEYQFLWGFSLLVLYHGQDVSSNRRIALLAPYQGFATEDSVTEVATPPGFNAYEVMLPVFQFLCSERFFRAGYISRERCQELLQVFAFCINLGSSWNNLAISVATQILANCPEGFLEEDSFVFLVTELCLAYIYKTFWREDDNSADHQRREDLATPVVTMAKTLLQRLSPKKLLVSSLLALTLIGHKCVRASASELYFLKAKDLVNAAFPLWKSMIFDNSRWGSDFAAQLPFLIETNLSMITKSINECIEAIHMLQKKESGSLKLILTKLAFWSEQIIVFAKLAYECLNLNNNNSHCISLLRHCTKCFESLFTDSNVQVQAIGVQVMKSMLQRECKEVETKFLIFFAGELIETILSTMLNMFERKVTKESMAIISEYLRLLVLLQTLSKSSEGQKGFMILLLETVIMIFSQPDTSTEEVTDLRRISIKLVSSIVQIPSSAVHFKDALLSLPAEHRQLLQEIIRGSVVQNQPVQQINFAAPSLEIKLPASSVEVKGIQPLPAPSKSFQSGDSADESDEEDDWDTFQSFSAPSDVNASNEGGTQETWEENVVNAEIADSSAIGSPERSGESSSLELLNKTGLRPAFENNKMEELQSPPSEDKFAALESEENVETESPESRHSGSSCSSKSVENIPLENADSLGLTKKTCSEPLTGTEPQHSHHSGVSDWAGSAESHGEVDTKESASEMDPPPNVDSGDSPPAADSEGSGKMPGLDSPYSHHSGVSDEGGSVKNPGELKGEKLLMETDQEIDSDVQPLGNASEGLSRINAEGENQRWMDGTGNNIIEGVSSFPSSELAEEEDSPRKSSSSRKRPTPDNSSASSRSSSTG
ncbi:hypothetical protein MLD38_001547 [Melastoma candidum]|uniref:Uncharacterized protein n=1 Tax=Melastoma candidum TaxID=119954 RepID=A0ACB9SD13_9MYRT|nr:hypothetical protein MLD38_001547 [Melastoma candidum]